MELPIDSIVIGDRSRRDLRNLDSLAESIRERGVLHPPVVRVEGDRYILVAGARRLAAMRDLGFDRVTVTVARSITDELSALYAEGEENTEREPFLPSEAAAHAERIEAVIAAKAKERMVDGGRGKGSAKLADPPDERETRTRVAKAVGMGRTSLGKARAVTAAAKDETLPAPVRETAKAAVVEMDRSGKVDGAHKRVEQAVQVADAVAEFPFLVDYEDDDARLSTAAALRAIPEGPKRDARIEAAKTWPLALEGRRNSPPDDTSYVDVAAAISAQLTANLRLVDALPYVGAAMSEAHTTELDEWRAAADRGVELLTKLTTEMNPRLRRVK